MAKDNKSLDGTVAPKEFLIVMQDFADYKRGDAIRDAEKIKELLHSEQAPFVNLIKEGKND